MDGQLLNIGAVSIGLIAMAALSAAVLLLVRLLRHPAPGGPARPLLLDDSAFDAPRGPPRGRAPAGPPQPPRLAASLLSPRAPSRLRFPLRLTIGRILELNLPLRLDWSGDYPLDRVELRLLLPNEITYGPSLERLIVEAPRALPGAAARYASGQTHTLVTVAAPQLAAKASATLVVPISVKPGAAGAFPVQITLSCPSLGEKERRYRLELIEVADDAQAADVAVATPDAWTCLPDEASRLTDPDQPLDRLASTRFAVIEPPL